MKTVYTFLTMLVLNLLSHQALAMNYNNSDLRKSVIREFLKQANNPKSKVGKIIAIENEETTDGRNHDGTIVIPVTEDDLQVVVPEEETMHQIWHYASREGNACVGSGDSAKYLIYLSQNSEVHAAAEFTTLLFSVSVGEIWSVKILEPSKFEICDDVIENPGSTFGTPRRKLEVGEFSIVKDQ